MRDLRSLFIVVGNSQLQKAVNMGDRYMDRNEHENQAARDGMTNGKRPSLRGIYFIGLAATAIGIAVIIFLNLAIPGIKGPHIM